MPDSPDPPDYPPEGREHPHRLPRGSYREPGQPVFVSIHAKAAPTSLASPASAAPIVDTMRIVAGAEGVRILAYCVMPNHLHAVVLLRDEGGDLARWVRSVKARSARALGRPGLWQRSYWDRHARKFADLGTMVGYTLCNPVRWGLCESWQEWPWCWSSFHEDSPGPDPNPPIQPGS